MATKKDIWQRFSFIPVYSIISSSCPIPLFLALTSTLYTYIHSARHTSLYWPDERQHRLLETLPSFFFLAVSLFINSCYKYTNMFLQNAFASHIDHMRAMAMRIHILLAAVYIYIRIHSHTYVYTYTDGGLPSHYVIN